MDKSKILAIIFFSILAAGVLLVIIAAALTVFFRQKVQDASKEQFSLAPGTFAYKRWLKESSSSPVYERFYLFNVTNPDQASTAEEKPNLRQIGPYTYRVQQTKENVVRSDDGTQLSYTQTKKYIFERGLSDGNDPADLVTTVNIPIVALASMLSYYNETIQNAVNYELLNVSKEPLFAQISVKELLWGYQNQGLFRTLIFLENWYHIVPIQDPIFGLEYRTGVPIGVKRNDFKISSGTDDINLVYQINEWNSHRSLPYWTSQYSNSIYGSEAMSWSPFLSNELSAFHPDWCRAVHYTRVSNSTENEELDNSNNTDVFTSGNSSDKVRWHYTLPHEVLDKSKKNAGFCTPSDHCTENGVLNVTLCRDKFPIYLSQPHFYKASDKYTRAVDGLTPHSEEHRTRLSVDPDSGFVMKSQLKLQYNAKIEASEAFRAMDYFNSSVILPVAWKETIFDMSLSDQNAIERAVADSKAAGAQYGWDQYIVYGVGALLALIGIVGLVVLFVHHKCTGKEDQNGERRPLLHDQR